MKLESGKHYLNASGEIVKIIIKDDENVIYKFKDGNQLCYLENGRFLCDKEESGFDLIAEIPTELHWSIIQQVLNYHKNINSRNKIKRRYQNFKNCNVKGYIYENLPYL